MTDTSQSSFSKIVSTPIAGFSKGWQHLMAWCYMIIIMCDFVVFPILWSLLQAHLKQPITEWQPLTLTSGGLFHMAMGGILGVAAWKYVGNSQQNTGQ